MKKISKNVLFVVIGILLAFTIDVAAEAVISSGAVSYSNTTVSAALDELFSAVDINNKIGTTDISAIGDGTVTGAINTVNNNFDKLVIRKVLAIQQTFNANQALLLKKAYAIPEGYSIISVFSSTSNTDVRATNASWNGTDGGAGTVLAENRTSSAVTCKIYISLLMIKTDFLEFYDEI